MRCATLGFRISAGLDGDSERGSIVGNDTRLAAELGNFVPREGAMRSCQRFLPIAQTSSQEEPPISIPCVLHTQAISHASKVIPSMNNA